MFNNLNKKFFNYDIIKKTPLEYCERLSKLFKNNIYFKREDLQNTRSFKIRGSLNKILNTNINGEIVTCSAGNHAQGVAYVSRLLGLKANIFIPEITPLQKIDKIKYFGGNNIKLNIIGNNLTESFEESAKFSEKNKFEFIHPFDDLDVIIGQSTIVNEIIFDMICEDIDYLIVPVGGGGLISGMTKIKDLNNNNIKIIGVEPEGANSMQISMLNNEITEKKYLDTFVDGASVSRIGQNNFDICIRDNKIDKIFTVSNNKLCKNMVDLFNYEGIITEPAGALSVTCLEDLINLNNIENKNIICIISGGNNDILRYSEIYERKLRYEKLVYSYEVTFLQKSGELKRFMENKSFNDIDIIEFNYKKYNNNAYGKVRISVQTHKSDQIKFFEKYMSDNGIQYVRIE